MISLFICIGITVIIAAVLTTVLGCWGGFVHPSPLPGAEAGLAEQVQGQPPEAAPGGGKPFRGSLQAVCRRQAGP